MENRKEVFRTRISVLIIVILLIPIVDIIFIHKLPKLSCRDMYLLGLVYFFVFLTMAGIRYVISDSKLSLKLFWIIPFGSANIANIVSIKRTYNPLSSLSFSFKRLSIRSKTGFGWMLISPVREKEFIDVLKAINPDIHIKIPETKGIWRVWDWDI